MMIGKNIRWAALSGVALCAVTLSASVHAQVSDPRDEPAPDASALVEEEHEIVVSGYRASQVASQEAKRRAPVVIEAISPEDIGKFSDTSIADQLQRVPGVQIDRNSDGRSGDRISVRGIGPQYVSSTVNGRTPGGYGYEGQRFLRQFAVESLPAEALNGVTIYKSSSAEMPEPGLGGAVDYQTIRPLDSGAWQGRNVFAAATAKISNNSGTSEWGKTLSGVAGVRNGADTLGVAIAGVWGNNPLNADFVELVASQLTPVQVRSADGGVVTQNVVYPNSINFGRFRRDDKRLAFSIDVQWRPTDQVELNIDYFRSDYDRPDNRIFNVLYYGSGNLLQGIFEPGGLTIDNGVVTQLDFSKYSPPAGEAATPPLYLGFPLQYDNESTTQVGGINAKWSDDRLSGAIDLSLSRTDNLQNLGWFYAPRQYDSISYLNYMATADGPPILNAGAPVFDKATDFDIIGGLRRYFQLENSGGSAKLDLAYKLDEDSLTLKTGVRFAEANVDVRNAFNVNFALTPEQQAAVKSVYPGGSAELFSRYGFGSVASTANQDPSSADIFPPLDFSRGPLGGPFLDASQPQGSWSSSADPSIGYLYAATEKTLAGYLQLDAQDVMVFGLPASGNVGLRAVKTWETATAFQTISSQSGASGQIFTTTNFVPAQSENSYTNLLPSLNVNVHPSDATSIRFSVAETLTRPEYLDRAPNNNVTVPAADYLAANPAAVGTGTTGNPRLRPQKSWNFDLTFEHYGRRGSAYVASLFYKRVSDFIAPASVLNTTVPGFGSQLFNLTQPQNVSSGHAYGAEVGFHQPLDVIAPALKGFGVQANYTYVESKIDAPIAGYKVGFPGVSKHNVNGTLYYSRGILDARVAFVHRSAFLSSFPWPGYVAFPVSSDPITTVDASLTLELTENLSLTGTISNLTRQDRRQYIGNTADFVNFYTTPRTVAFSVRAKL